MRGEHDSQTAAFCYVDLESRVRADHPLRAIKHMADGALRRLSPTFDGMYSTVGRPSIPPERLLKSMVLIALYSVRSDRQFCERLNFDMQFRWFLDMNLEEPSFDASTFSKNRERLLEHAVSRKFFDEIVKLARKEELLSDDHFTVDGTLIEAWASMKSFVPNDQEDEDPPAGGGSNAEVDFRGQRRSNATHHSTTDDEAELLRKGLGKEAKLCFGGHVLMENRNGLCVDVEVDRATTRETEVAQRMLDRQRRRRIKPKSIGADKGYHSQAFVDYCLRHKIRPHVAMISGRGTWGMTRKLIQSRAYSISQRIRKRVEEIFGWAKTIGGLRKTRYRGVARTNHLAEMVAATYNLVRMARLLPLGVT